MQVQLLSIVAIRLGEPQDHPFLNSTAASLPTSTTFEPSTASIVINALWIISLVLSLVSALFGILAKQWCREYLTWYSAPQRAIDNVMLRQMRYEAWQRSNASAYIASVPALLEIALVMFLAGLVAFVWTLQRLVAILVTSAVGVSLAIVFILTLLPLFSRLSPYKSPTGWAFVRLGQVCARVVHFVQTQVLDLDTRPMEASLDWRHRDLQFADNPDRHVTAALRKFLGSDDSESSPVDAFQADLLARALAWVRQGSNEGMVFAAIRESAQGLHAQRSQRRNLNKIVQREENTTIPYCASLQMLRGVWPDRERLERWMVRAHSIHRESSSEPEPHFWIVPRTTFAFRLEVYVSSSASIIGEYENLSIIRECVVSDLVELVGRWDTEQRSQFRDVRFQYFTVTRRIVVLLGILRLVVTSISQNDPRRKEYLRHVSHILVTLLRTLWPLETSFRSGIMTAMLHVLGCIANVTLDADDDAIISGTPSSSSTPLALTH